MIAIPRVLSQRLIPARLSEFACGEPAGSIPLSAAADAVASAVVDSERGSRMPLAEIRLWRRKPARYLVGGSLFPPNYVPPKRAGLRLVGLKGEGGRS